MRVYGNQIEPGGMELAHDTVQFDCQYCGGKGTFFFSTWQTCHGGCINNHKSEWCENCGYSEPDLFEDE